MSLILGFPSLSYPSSYTGDWFDDLPHGTGEYQWRAGHKYYGDYKAGVPEGNGVFETSRGDIYQVAICGNTLLQETYRLKKKYDWSWVA